MPDNKEMNRSSNDTRALGLGNHRQTTAITTNAVISTVIRLNSMADEAQQIWTDYYARIRRRRVAEAEFLNSQMLADGVTNDTILAIDFKHFGTVESDIRRLAEQLSENYSMTVSVSDDGKTWVANGTTRPYGVDGMLGDQLQGWVEFMCDVSNSCACVLSTWKTTDTGRKLEWSNEDLDLDPETVGG